MAYVSQQDLIDRIGEDALYVLTDRVGQGTLDAARIAAAADEASSEIDAYLSKRYALPLASTPPVIGRLALDICVYRLAADAGNYTEERRKRYEDATALLKRIAGGDVGLGVSQAAEDAADKQVLIAGGEIVVEANPPRLSGRQHGGGWPV